MILGMLILFFLIFSVGRSRESDQRMVEEVELLPIPITLNWIGDRFVFAIIIIIKCFNNSNVEKRAEANSSNYFEWLCLLCLSTTQSN